MAEPRPRYRCAHCKGTNIEIGMWVDPNAASVEPAELEWIHDEPVDGIGLSATFWCRDCESHAHGVERGESVREEPDHAALEAAEDAERLLIEELAFAVSGKPPCGHPGCRLRAGHGGIHRVEVDRA